MQMDATKGILISLLICFVTSALIGPASCLFCRNCDAVHDDDDCQNAHACQAGEICYHDVELNSTGSYTRLGCRSATACPGALQVIGRRANTNTICSSCCDKDLCKTTACQNIDHCLLNPCVFGACRNLVNDYTCTCHHGYSGKNCDAHSSTDPCASNPCLHGTCAKSGDHFTCTCSFGYTGSTCDTLDPCLSNPCVFGTCHPVGSMFACVCERGYSGTKCNVASTCQPNPCVHGACSPTGSSTYRCICNTGYTGNTCNTVTNPCAANPCTHGRCIDQRSSSYTCQCDVGYAGPNCGKKIRDCKDALDYHMPSPSGDVMYTVKIGYTNENVRCDMATDGGGWTVIMNRETARINFTKDSTDYALGFGNSRSDFWIGLEDMHTLTSDGRRYQLRVELTRGDGSKYYEVYDDFSIGSRPDYVLHIGAARGTAGDSLRHHSGYGFTTVDHDVDSNKNDNCAQYLQGAWWFHECYDSCLTCPYETPGARNKCRSMSWKSINYCEALKAARMLVRPM